MSSPEDPSSSAEQLFADWLASRDAPGQGSLDRLCEEHPELASELRELWIHRAWIHSILGRETSSAPSRQSPRSRGGEALRAELLLRLARFSESSMRYSVQGEIGRGSMGSVLRVRDEQLRRPLAMKVALPSGGATGDASDRSPSVRQLARFLEEAEITSRLDHPGIVPVHELGLDDRGRVFFTMKLVEGKTLREVFDELARGEGGWTRPSVLGLILKVCDAMSYAHSKGVVHRDLKPGNVMVGRYGEVYVMDWGLAKVLNQAEDDPRVRSAGAASDDGLPGSPDCPLVTLEGEVVGTPAYMSPEQAEGRVAEMGPRSDVYALGAMLYHLLAGHMPYVRPGDEASSLLVLRRVREGPPPALEREAADVPPELAAICGRAMARDAAQRYADMAALGEDLRAYLEQRVVRAYRTGALAELRKWVRRNRFAAITAAAATLALAAGAALYVSGITSAHAETVEALRRTRALGLASASDEVLEKDTMLALLLAREAVRIEPTPETLSRLHQVVGTVRERGRIEHDAAFVDAIFSPQGDRILGIADGVALLSRLDGLVPTGTPVRLEGHGGYLTSASFSPRSGDRILTTSQDGTGRLWDLAGRELARFGRGEFGWAYAAAFSPDARYVVIASEDGVARLWEAADDSQPLALLRGHTGPLRAAAFSPDGRHVLTASEDATGRLWRFDEEEGTAECVAVLRGHEGPIIATSFSPDGARILTASGVEGIWSKSGDPDDTARIWDLSGTESAVLEGHAGGVEWAVFSPAGDHVLTASSDQTGRLWDLEGRQLMVFGLPNRSVAWRCAFAPDSRFVAFGCADGMAWIFDVFGTPIGPVGGHEQAVNSIRFSADGRSLATASIDGTVRLWNVLDDDLPTFHGHRAGLYRAVYSPDGTRVATGSADGTVRLWDRNGDPAGAPLRAHRSAVYAVEFSPDGEHLLSASRDKTAILWSLQGHVVRRFSHEPDVLLVADAAFSPDGRRVVTGCRDGTVAVWDVATGSELRRFRGKGMVEQVEFAPDGQHVLLGRYVGPVLLLSLEDGSERSLGRAGIQASFSADGTRILIASEDGRALLTDLEGDVVTELGGHSGLVTMASFSPSGDRVVTASLDGTARIWNVDGTQVATLRGHAGGLWSAVFSPDGDRVLTASVDGTARTWIVDPASLVELADARIVRPLTEGELRTYAPLLEGGD